MLKSEDYTNACAEFANAQIIVWPDVATIKVNIGPVPSAVVDPCVVKVLKHGKNARITLRRSGTVTQRASV